MAKTMASGAMVAASFRGQRTCNGRANEQIGALDGRIGQAAADLLGVGLLGQFSLVALQPSGAAGDQDAVLVDGDDVLGAGHLQHVDDGRTGRAGAVLHNLNILDAFAHHFQGVRARRPAR